ncbi:hypothetical protein JW960_09820 [candidate division KSB1 bacterium]|nr:hypothetical protein [candidate division KSB1 bacterium]
MVKKMMFIWAILGLSLLLTSENNLSFCKKLVGMDQESSAYTFYSRISENYYGTPDYWNELSIVNNGAVDKPVNELIIPSLKSIDKLKSNRSVTVAELAHNATF